MRSPKAQAFRGQAALDLGVAPEPCFATFVKGEGNARALAYLRNPDSWPSAVVLVVGPEGSGKTYLGKAFVAEVEGARFADDADAWNEAELFALINRALGGEVARLVLASRKPLEDWDVKTPDLVSRLRNMPVVTLEEPGDDILEPVLRGLWAAVGRSVDQEVVDFMLRRCPRGVAELRAVVAEIEEEARSERADVTKAYVARVLAREPELFDGLD